MPTAAPTPEMELLERELIGQERQHVARFERPAMGHGEDEVEGAHRGDRDQAGDREQRRQIAGSVMIAEARDGSGAVERGRLVELLRDAGERRRDQDHAERHAEPDVGEMFTAVSAIAGSDSQCTGC